MLTFASKYGCNVYSQFGEDGIIDEAIRRIKPEVKTCIEFGGADGYYCSNTRHLIDQGWTGKMYDMHPGHPSVEKKEITPENVNDIGDCTVLSIDTDNNDYHIWKAYKFKPAIVIIEINSSVDPMVDMIPGEHGASFKSMVELAINKGYFLLAHTGNCIFVWNKYKHLFPEIKGYPIKDHELYFNKSHLPC